MPVVRWIPNGPMGYGRLPQPHRPDGSSRAGQISAMAPLAHSGRFSLWR